MREIHRVLVLCGPRTVVFEFDPLYGLQKLGHPVRVKVTPAPPYDAEENFCPLYGFTIIVLVICCNSVVGKSVTTTRLQCLRQ